MVLPTAFISISVSEIVIAMTSSVPVFIHVTSPVYVCDIVIYQIIIFQTKIHVNVALKLSNPSEGFSHSYVCHLKLLQTSKNERIN